MTRGIRWFILVFALVGLAFASSSAWVHYRLVTDPTYVSPCDINATFNCSQVYLSRFGSVAGVPVAIGGMIWFALVALLAGFASPSSAEKSPAASYIFAISMVGLAVVLYLGYTSFVTLKTGCVLCIGTYVSVIAIFIASGLAASVSLARLPRRFVSDVRALIAEPPTFLAAVLFVAGAASVVAFFPRESTPQTQAATAQSSQTSATDDVDKAFAAAWAQQPRVDLGIPAAGATVLIVKFIDWQCPSCKAAHFTYKPVLDKFEQSHPGAVRQVIKDFPLNSRCNFTMSQDAHIAACEEAVAVRLARDKGKADEFVDWLFNVPDQQGLPPATVKAEVAKRLGVTDFDKEYAARLPAIQRDVADGVALKVHSTPTYFVNGIKAESDRGWLPAHYFELAIRLELEKAGMAVR